MAVDVYESLEQQRRVTLTSVWKARVFSLMLLPLVFLPVALLVLVIAHENFSGLLSDIGASLLPRIQDQMNLVVVGLMIWVVAGLWLLGKYFRSKGRQPVWDYLNNYKTVVFEHLCKSYFPTLNYDAKGGIDYDIFDGMQLFPYQSDWYYSEDFFSGRHGQTQIHFAEVHAKRERSHWQDGRLRKYDDTFFRGLVFVADFHKHFHCTARLIPVGKKLAKIRSQKAVTLEDPAFEECFQTVASDQTDIRYVLSTSMMQRLLRLEAQFHGLRAMFSNDRLTLMLPGTRDRFEPSLYARANSTSQIDGLVQEIRVLLDIVDELDLNTRIWSKT